MSRAAKVGDIVKVTGIAGGHGLQIGKRYIVAVINQNGISHQLKDLKSEQVYTNWITPADFKLCPSTLLELKREKRQLSTELKAVVSKINYLTETGAKELNEDEWLMNHAFDTLDAQTPRPTTRAERAAAMTKILKSLGYLN